MERIPKPSDDKQAPKPIDPRGIPPLRSPKPSIPDPQVDSHPKNSPDGTQESGELGQAVPKPADAFWNNFTDPITNKDIPTRAKSTFFYGEALGRTLSGWRVKAVSLLFTPSNATKVELYAIRGVIKGVGKGFVFVAPLSAIVDLVNTFRKYRIGTAAFYQNYGIAGLGAIGGILGGAAFDTFGFGLLASFGVSGIGLFILFPLLFGLVGAGVLQWIGSKLNENTQADSFLYNWYPGSFLDRFVSSVNETGIIGAIVGAVGAVVWFGLWGAALLTPLGWVGLALAVVVLFGAALAGGALFQHVPGNKSNDDATTSSKRGKRIRLKPIKHRGKRRVLPPPTLLAWWHWGWPDFLPVVGGDDPGKFDGGAGGGGPGRRPGGGGVPVGGVLFENCHTVLTGIAELTGAYWDEPTHSLVLIGKDTDSGGRMDYTLPAMDADHLKVALRAALVSESLGVSIDAPAEYRYGNGERQMPPSGSPLIVSYLGGCSETLSGAIFFEADRIMKCLSLGVHNETRKAFAAKVPGFRTAFELHENGGHSRNHSWHRFWFVVERVELKRCAQSGALTFGEVKIVVKTELELRGSTPGQLVDPFDTQFAEHLTTHYDEYAKEFPVFARLKELAKISALASFVVNEMIELDLGDIVNSPPVEVLTPETTPSFLRSKSTQNGNVIYTHMMSGGVDMRVSPLIREDFDRGAARLRQSADSSRATFAQEWKFRVGNDSLCAKALVLGPARKFRPVETDHHFPAIPGLPPFSFERVYDSTSPGDGMFGTGWSVLLPWSLTILRGSGKRREVLDPNSGDKRSSLPPAIVMCHGRSGRTQLFRLLSDSKDSGNPIWARVISQTVQKNGMSFHYDSENVIRRQEKRFVAERNGRKYYFDESGLLVQVSGEGGISVDYTWSKRRLVKVEDRSGRGYSIVYRDEGELVKSVQATDGRNLDYSYSPDGSLREVRVASQCRSFYGYDMSGRLTEVTDSAGAVITRAVYSASGEYVNTPTADSINLPDGQKITRVFVNDRLAFVADENGSRVDFSYGLKGNLRELTIRSRNGLSWKIEYGNDRRLRGVLDPVGRATEFECDQQGRIVSVALPGKCEVVAKRDDQDRIIEVSTAAGESWKALFGANGMLTSVSASPRKRIDFKYARGLLSGLEVIGGNRNSAFHVGPRPNPIGTHLDFQFDGPGFGEKVGRRFVGRHRIKRKIGPYGKSVKTLGPAGTISVSSLTANPANVVVEFSW